MEEGERRSGVSIEAHGELAERDNPGQRTLDHPSVTTQSLARVHATPSNPWDDPTLPQCSPREPEVVALVRVQLGRAFAGPSWCPDRTTNRLDRIHQKLQQLRVVDVGGRELNRQRDALPIDHEMVFAASFATVGRAWPRVLAATLGSNADAVDAGTAPVDRVQVAQPVEYDLVHRGPDAQFLPMVQTTPTGHSAAVAQLLREVSPSQPVPQDEQDAAERGAVSYSRRSAVVAAWFGREERFERFPEIVADGMCAAHHRA